MSILVYHGSPTSFKEFKIKEEYSNRSISLLAEGLGIYMTEKKELAASYGSFLYQIQLMEEDISDFTNRNQIIDLIKIISSDVNIDIEAEIDLESIIVGVISGDLSATSMYKEISDWLDSSESFYNRYSELITYGDDCIFERVKKSFFNNVKDIIRYYDKSFKAPIYICFKNEKKLSIVSVINID